MTGKAFTLKTIAWGTLFTLALLHATYSAASVRLKDIVHFEGVRGNQLVGYGLVVGLSGTGDDAKTSPFTGESLVSMLERLGVSVRSKSGELKGKNVAAVIVTATLPPFSRMGTHVDVNVSALGNAKSLLGGTLLVTPLLAADGQVYAVSQGTVAVGGFTAGSDKSGSSVTKGVPTSGTVANGAIVEKEIGFELAQKSSLNLSLRNPDFTTASRVANVINAFTKSSFCQWSSKIEPHGRAKLSHFG
ncbi:MAG: hypothetical protein GY915_09340 [bacterium]|nr:hypothetical protein [bacterium]